MLISDNIEKLYNLRHDFVLFNPKKTSYDFGDEALYEDQDFVAEIQR